MASGGIALRRNLILTVGLVWLLAVAVIAVMTLSSGEEVTGPDPAMVEQCRALHPEVENLTERLRCIVPIPYSTWTEYDVQSAVVQVVLSTVIAVALLGAVGVWTRGRRVANTAGPSTVPVALSGMVNVTAPTPPSPGSEPIPTSSAAGGESPNSTASALRQLKALHDEGILSEDEYETKRKALTDRL